MKILILTPEKKYYEGQAISLQYTDMNCSFQVLDHHDSMIAILKKGKIQLDKNKSIYSIKHGILEIKNGMVKILIY